MICRNKTLAYGTPTCGCRRGRRVPLLWVPGRSRGRAGIWTSRRCGGRFELPTYSNCSGGGPSPCVACRRVGPVRSMKTRLRDAAASSACSWNARYGVVSGPAADRAMPSTSGFSPQNRPRCTAARSNFAGGSASSRRSRRMPRGNRRLADRLTHLPAALAPSGVSDRVNARNCAVCDFRDTRVCLPA